MSSHRRLLPLLATLGLLAALLSGALPAAGAAPTVQLARTGQTRCYSPTSPLGEQVSCDNTGQDGNLRAGVIWPTPRFQHHADGTTTDLLTGLMWTTNAETPGYWLYTCGGSTITRNMAEALAHIDCLNSRRYGGYSDWRLPNVVEMESLINPDYVYSDDWLEEQGFINPWGYYWTSTTAVGSPLAAYAVKTGTGDVTINYKAGTTYNPAVWPVRGTSDGPASLWQTGQTTCYSTTVSSGGAVMPCSLANKQDGFYRAGAAWPNPRFSPSGECMTDNLTGLMWPVNASLLGGLVSFKAALDDANTRTLCGYDDWRMPNRKELFSLANYGVADQKAWLQGVGFRNVMTDTLYWSSTTYVYQTNCAWGLWLNSAGVYPQVKSHGYTGNYWPVRGGQVLADPTATPTARPSVTPTRTPTPSPSPTPRPAPQVAEVLPREALNTLAASLRVSGARFQPGATVRLGASLALSTTFVSASELVAHVPANLAAGFYDVTVRNPDGRSGTLAGAYRVQGAAQDDLYALAYELYPDRQVEQVGQATHVNLIVRRLGGSAALSNVRADLYLGDPSAGGPYLGQVTAASLSPNGWALLTLPWTPSTAGTFQLYARLDPQNAVAESDETNNLYHNWVQVLAAPPRDTTPPGAPTLRINGGALTTYNSSVSLEVLASDTPGGSGVAWVDFVVWEYFPSLSAWLATDESGWVAAEDGRWTTYGYALPYFSGPRWVQVWSADRDDNISPTPGAALINYILPEDYVWQDESRLYAYPLAAGQVLGAQLASAWGDADLYLWYPDGHATYAANQAAANESATLVAPTAGWYWVEVYGYTNAAYSLQMGGAEQVQVGVGAAPMAGQRPRTVPRVAASNIPSGKFRLSPLDDRIYLPLVRR